MPPLSRSTAVAALLTAAVLAPAAAPIQPFQIHVVDADTGRGVPLVELRTVHNLRLVTDSNGVAAFDEPGLIGQKVYFHVQSHGYEFAKDGFGFRGKALDVHPGGSAKLEVKRRNVAERLYRVTGAGIYADSLRVGRRVPLANPVLNAQVLGSDSVVNAVYRGKVYWFWGDTNRASYPLGNYHVPGATSKLPTDGGLDPDAGVDLEYFLDRNAFAKPTAQMPGDGPTWIHGLFVLRDGGRERMFAAYMKVRGSLDVYERGLAEFDDGKEQFEKVVTFPADAPIHLSGHPFLHRVDGVEYVYFATPYPLLRVRADPAAVRDLSQYEAFTCLEAGSRAADGKLDRGSDGRLRYGWKKNTAVVGPTEQAKLVKAGKLRPDEALLNLRDADTGKAVTAHGGSVYWNEYRRRWVMIAVEAGGSTSLLGEVWYAEADTPLGPWAYARKVVTHDRYSFYNPKQHPMFDRDGGKVIYFEGTYTHTFSGNPDQTPRYDYNQIMYKLDLTDPRLALPVPVYRQNGSTLATAVAVKDHDATPVTAFFALDRPGKGTLPVFAESDPGTPLFYALPADATDASTTPLLYEYRHADGRVTFAADGDDPGAGWRRVEKPLGRVWRNPAPKVTLPRREGAR